MLLDRDVKAAINLLYFLEWMMGQPVEEHVRGREHARRAYVSQHETANTMIPVSILSWVQPATNS